MNVLKIGPLPWIPDKAWQGFWLFCQVSRTGRVRAPPLAFWANERISRNADQAGGSAIERGFSDQLAQQCESFIQSPAKKPRKASAALHSPRHFS